MSICSRNQQQGERSPVATGAECSVLQNPILSGTAEGVPVHGRNMEPVLRRELLESLLPPMQRYYRSVQKSQGEELSSTMNWSDVWRCIQCPFCLPQFCGAVQGSKHGSAPCYDYYYYLFSATGIMRK